MHSDRVLRKFKLWHLPHFQRLVRRFTRVMTQFLAVDAAAIANARDLLKETPDILRTQRAHSTFRDKVDRTQA